MGIKVNLTDVQGMTTYEAIPTGWYHVVVTDGEIKESGQQAKNPGAQYINWEFTIQDGEHENRKVWSITSLLPQALFALKGLLQAIGWDEDRLAGELDFEIEDLVGEELDVKVTRQMYEGDWKNQVKGYRPHQEGEQTEANLLA